MKTSTPSNGSGAFALFQAFRLIQAKKLKLLYMKIKH